jgi:SAM-dependent methyltransferase
MTPATFYDREYFEGQRRQSPPHTRRLIYPLAERTAKYLCRRKTPDLALDLGCAKGYLVEALQACGVPLVVGMDVSRYALSHCEAPVKGRVLIGDVSVAIPLRSSTCDLITVLDLFEHLADPLPALKEIRRLLTDRGSAYLKICHPRHPNARRDPSHVNVQPSSYWRRLFTQANFEWKRVYETDVTGALTRSDRCASFLRLIKEWAVIGNPADYKFLLWKPS